MSKLYADRFYKDSKGNYYTGEYLKNHYHLDHNAALQNGYTWLTHGDGSAWDKFQRELKGKTINCNYSQIFNINSALILANNTPHVFDEIWDNLINGEVYDDETDTFSEIYQYFIIDDSTADRLKEHTTELIFYWPEMDVYILGVTHLGTGWDHVSAEFVY